MIHCTGKGTFSLKQGEGGRKDVAVASARPFNDDLGGITRSVNLLTNEACNLMGLFLESLRRVNIFYRLMRIKNSR